MIRHALLISAAAFAALTVSPLQATQIFWQGGTNTLTSNNWRSAGNPANRLPVAVDVLHVGLGGTANHAVAGTTPYEKLRVGHNSATNPGAGTVNVNNGLVDLTVGGANAADASLWVGRDQNGVLNIDGAGSSVKVARLAVIGFGVDINQAGTVNVMNGGSLTITLGNILLGETSAMNNAQGVQGHLFINGTVALQEAASNLRIGMRGATSSVTLSGGSLAVGNQIEVGAANGNANSSFTMTGVSTASTGNGGNGNFVVGLGATVGATANIQGGTLNVGRRFLLGTGTATSAVTNHTAGTVNAGFDMRIADAFETPTNDATYYLSGTGVINTGTVNNANFNIVGRQGDGKFFQSGGVANFTQLAIGRREAAIVLGNKGLYEISAGDLNINAAFEIATNGTGQFRVVGEDATIDVGTTFTLGTSSNGNGTLAFELETGESLSTINVGGAATLAAGTIVTIDASNATFGQWRYDLVNAASVTDGGIVFNAPPGWWYRIIEGGNGQILQAVVPEPSTAGLVLVGCALLAARRRVVAAI